ncbi:MAG TPA: GH1 family beta-glucosidase [Anaerolineales bacterium]|nr:GH1 family beta-glucosidase [Anaerolineales bacterium]
MPYPQFPKGFLFGTASAAFQIEGSPAADGKGPSIWDTFTSAPGRIKGGDTAVTACDTYLHPEGDVQRMAELGLNAYRFSVAWSRVMPEGRGPVNQKGLDYYRRLVDTLLARGIAPFITLYHWDMPQALEDLCGGFAGRDCASYFADYAGAVVKALGDRAKNWMTLNEPWEHAAFGHLLGSHAPGRHNPWTYFRVAHHELLGHGLALERIHSISPDSRVGLVLSLTPIFPATSRPRDVHAAHVADQFFNDFYLDGIFKGRYPDPLWRQARLAHPRIGPEDMKIISRPMDFLGVNYYSREFARSAWYVPFLGTWVDEVEVHGKEAIVNGRQYTSSGREVYPPAFYDLLMRLKNEYGNPPMYITENGASFTDTVENGKVHDPLRVAFLEGYMGEAAHAARDGANLKGYFIWSLTDNFEWSLGYSARFGLVHVNFSTQERVVKDSGYWVKALVENQRP